MAWLSNESKASNSTKVREGDFSPRTRRLAIMSKAYIRTSMCVQYITRSAQSLPPVICHAWILLGAQLKTSKNSKDPIMVDAFSRATKDDATKKQLIKFVSETFSIVLPLLT